MEIKTVDIIGLGAEGSVVYDALRSRLSKEQVRVIAKGERAERLRKNGIEINGTKYELNVTEPGFSSVKPDLIVIAVKSYQLKDIFSDIEAELGKDTMLISFINGLSSEDILAERFGAERVIYSMSKISSRKEGSKVFYTTFGYIAVGEKDGSHTERLDVIKDLLADRVPCEVSGEIMLEIWRKYMFNAACNTVEAIFRGKHLWFQRIEEACDAMECIMQEIVQLANAAGVPLSQQDIRDLDGIFMGYSSEGMCSMAQDVVSGKQTEIDIFMGEALQLGRKYNIPTPVCRFVYDIVKSLDKVNAGILK